jgi:membrane protease subunit HflC
VKWRISDVVSFYTSTNGDFFRARSRLSDLINNTLKSAISQNTIQEAISDKRSEIMSSVQVAVNEKAANLGIEVTDVRIKRLDFPDNVRGKVFERMAKDREKEARELRSTGKEQANIITADADRQSQEILAEAYKQAEELRGEGDAKAAEVYAKAYGSDREFYKFYRSLDAYRSSFGSKSDVLVIEPDSEFFKYFNSSSGK